MKLLFITLFLFTFSLSVLAENIQREVVRYKPEKSGYEVEIPFASKFINCFGEVHVTITKNSKNITAKSYVKEGKSYSKNELGEEYFQKSAVGLTNISADVYHNSYLLGKIRMNNVIDWLGGCFGQTYHAMKLLGLDDAQYKDKVDQLYLKNIRVISADTKNSSVESAIDEKQKQKAITNKIQQADQAFASGNLENAKKLYQEAQKLDPSSNAYVQNQLKEVTEKLKQAANKQEFTNLFEQAGEKFADGDYENAKRLYEKALLLFPNDQKTQKKINEINKLISQEESAKKKRGSALTAASNRKHSGMFWGKNHGSDSAGSETQAANLIGNFRLDYNIWTQAGEPAHRFKFYWEWDNALNTGYPQWVSVLGDTVVMINELKKYPDLLARWNKIKPEYIELEVDILNYKNKGKFVADTGRMKVIPEVIGYSGQEVDWAQPSSSDWNVLFPYCNGLQWSYFRKLGIYQEISEYADKYGSNIAWPKYSFEFSDEINFFQGFKTFHSKYKTLSRTDYNNYSSSAEITKIVWPAEEILALIEEFKEREKRKKEENMTAEDFWSSPENDQSVSEDFWNTPEKNTTVNDVRQQKSRSAEQKLVNNHPAIVAKQREKYRALLSPFEISSPSNNTTVDKNVIDIKGKVNKYFLKYNSDIYLILNGVKQQVDVKNSGKFSNAMVLSNGKNDVKLQISARGFQVEQPLTVNYDGIDTDLRVTLTWNTSGSDLDLYVENPNRKVASYSNKNIDGMTLDVDDTSGYGPENISVRDADNGEYEIQVKNYSRGRGAEATVYIYVKEQLVDIKKHEFGRNKVWNVGSIRIKGE